MVGGAMESYMQILRVICVQDVHNHMIDELFLDIDLGVKRSGFSDISVQQ